MTGKTAAAAAAAGAATQPAIWTLLGYQFEAASMIAVLAACLMVRIWASLTDRPVRVWAWSIDLTVTTISMLFTAGWIVLQRPAPVFALLSGAGFGALGVGIIVMALAWVRRFEPLAAVDPSSPTAKSTAFAAPITDDDASIDREGH